jgi:F420-dependent oxidoreductase-like protein
MKLGLMLGYSGARLDLPLDLVKRAEELGYDSVWTAEAYGSDAITPLAYIAAHTSRIRLATGIMQLAGRAPAMCAMQVQTLDALAGGDRVIAGLGVSGPQIVEGWYGQPWGRPYYRLKDYVQIMRKIFERQGPVSHDGPEYQLPYHGPGSIGLGKPLTSILHTNPNVPIWLGAGSPDTIRLCAQLCDGWFPMHFTPQRWPQWKPLVEEGFARAGGGKGWDGYEIQPMINVYVTDDVPKALDSQKAGIALYAGGMGARGMNFHNDHMIQRGYGDVAQRVQELFLAGHKQEAAAAIPDEYVDEACLVGPPARIRERFRTWADTGITGLTVATSQGDAIEVMAEVAAMVG